MTFQTVTRLGAAIVILAAFTMVSTWRPAATQDDSEQRIDVLEARVTLLSLGAGRFALTNSRLSWCSVPREPHPNTSPPLKTAMAM